MKNSSSREESEAEDYRANYQNGPCSFSPSPVTFMRLTNLQIKGSMKRILALFLCLLVPTVVFASNNGYRVIYDGGSLPNAKTGDPLNLKLGDKDIHFSYARGGKEAIDIPASAITEISYGQDVHRRIGAAIGLAVVSFGVGALMALTKSKKHFVGLTWQDGDKRGGFAMQCDKNDYRGVLAGLEGITGKKAVDSDAMTVKN
jgi:hypothetical protein